MYTALLAAGLCCLTGLILYKLASLMRQCRQEPPMAPLIYLEGNIGAGKSTLAAKLAGLNRFQVIAEPVHEWQNVEGHNLLNLLYADRFTWNFPFQTLALTTLGKRQTEVLTNNPDKLVILERSPKCSIRVFAQYLENARMLKAEHMAVLRVLYATVAPITKRPVHYIYVRTPPHLVVERIARRGRSEELPITELYLNELHQVTDAWLLQEEQAPVHVIDGRQTPEEVLNEALKIIEAARTGHQTNSVSSTITQEIATNQLTQ